MGRIIPRGKTLEILKEFFKSVSCCCCGDAKERTVEEKKQTDRKREGTQQPFELSESDKLREHSVSVQKEKKSQLTAASPSTHTHTHI